MFSWFGKKAQIRVGTVQRRKRLYIPEKIYRRMINHCYEERPLEACGLLGGVGAQAESGFATDNAHRSPKLYKVDDRQLLEAFKEIQTGRQEIIAIYHSHVETEPVPSLTDIDQATFPEAFYVIVSLKARRPKVRAWQIIDRQVTEHQVVVQRDAAGAWHDLREAVRAAAKPAQPEDIS